MRFPDDLLRRHHLYVARTRMGKSTLMQRLVTHRLREKVEGRNGDAIVVVDPHADLVESILEHVPGSLAGSVRLVDLAGRGGYPGLNLLDTRVFADRDRTADSVVRVARGLWEQWGPRMQSILEQVVKTLHECNAHPETPADEQLTILDGLRLLSDDRFRSLVLERVADEFLLEWWAREFRGWRNEYRADALAPVQTRLSYYASSKRARAILGQPRSTIDLRRTILDGGVLLVSTAQGAAGRDVAALVGASVLNLVDAVPGGGLRRAPARLGARPRPRLRGGHRLAARAPRLRAGDGGERAHARLLDRGAQARRRQPRHGGPHPRGCGLLPAHRRGDRGAAGRGAQARRALDRGARGGPQGAGRDRERGRRSRAGQARVVRGGGPHGKRSRSKRTQTPDGAPAGDAA